MFNIFQMLFELCSPVYLCLWPALVAAAPTIAQYSTAAGGLMEGVGALMGGGESEQTDPHWQTEQANTYALTAQRASKIKILDMLAKRSYEGFPGGANLSNIASAAAIQSTKQKPPDYFAQSKEFASNMGDEGVSEVLSSFGGYAPQTEIYKAPEELTEWDKIAEANGIIVTKYNDFQSAQELREVLFKKYSGEVTVGSLDVAIGQQIAARLFPKFGLDKLCGIGQCDEIFAGIIRGIKASAKTFRAMNTALPTSTKKT